MKKRIIITFLAIILIAFGIYVAYSSDTKLTTNISNVTSKEKMISMYIVEEAGGSAVSETDTVPEGYVVDRFTCEKANSTTVDITVENGQLKITSNGAAKCSVYLIEGGLTLADYIISTYGTDNTLYYHTNTSASWQNGESTYSSLLAGDNSYRYSGASGDVNNYVCFGTTDTSTCTSSPDTYLYRIIGVFNGQVKLIKATSLGTKKWNENASAGGGSNGNDLETEEKYKIQLLSNAVRLSTYNDNDWEHSSTLNAYLNTDSSGYLQTMNNTWRALIDATHSWHVTGFSSTDTAKVTYTNEIGNTSATWNGTVGLMYVSDYGYAASPNKWNLTLRNSTDASYDYRSATDVNWLFLGSSEWTISPIIANITNLAWEVSSTGCVNSIANDGIVGEGKAVRSVFYLTSTTKIDTSVTSADGSSSHPYILKTQ